MSQPNVTVIRGNGNLGRSAASQDGVAGIIVSGVAVSGEFALGEVLGPFLQLSDAEDKGINKAYDIANTCLAWHHIRDFYNYAPVGSQLYVMVVAKTVTMAEMADKNENFVKTLIDQAGGAIRLIGITRVPDNGYTPAITGELEDDMWDCVSNAQTLQEDEFSARHRPFSIIVEGRNWQGDIGDTLDMRASGTSPNANRVTVMIGGDPLTRNVHAKAADYAAVGIVLGKAAAVPVNRNIGRVKDGSLKMVNVDFSSGDAYNVFTDADRDSLNDKGYVFFRSHIGKSGYYFNDDHTACVLTDDFAYLNRGRPLDKATRITRTVYLEDLLDEVELDSVTGKMNAASIKHYQASVEKAINEQMTALKEISGASAYVNPDQNILSTDKIVTELSIVPTGIARKIEATVAYSNPATV